MEYAVTTFYKFTPLPVSGLEAIKQQLVTRAAELDIIGLVLVAPEGINATLAGSQDNLATYKDFLQSQFGELFFKDSLSDVRPFKRFKVKIKPEIVQLQRPDVQPRGREKHVSPEEWDKLAQEPDVVLIDVRNWYENKLGTFKTAINPDTKTFSEFPEWIKESGLPKSQKIGIFCTGGIRCEKAAVALEEQGYQNVQQLDGGILNYIEQRPHQNFEGECFVFDHRTAVGQDLRPSTTYAICPHCGNGGHIQQTCLRCERAYKICDDCQPKQAVALCSKNCRYQFEQQAVG